MRARVLRILKIDSPFSDLLFRVAQMPGITSISSPSELEYVCDDGPIAIVNGRYLMYGSERLPGELLYWEHLFHVCGIDTNTVEVFDVDHAKALGDLIHRKGKPLYCVDKPMSLLQKLNDTSFSTYVSDRHALDRMGTVFAAIKPSVVVLSSTPDAAALVSSAASNCYTITRPSSMLPLLLDEEANQHVSKRIDQCLSSGHHSVTEHASFTFEIVLNRSASHQLVRHRLASYSQNSQRYIAAGNVVEVIPPEACFKNTSLMLQHLHTSQLIHAHALSMKEHYDLLDIKHKNEDTRALYTNDFATCVMMTMNVRSLLHFFNERCCTCAEWTIRTVANEMLKLCKEREPALFQYAGPKCVSLGYCTESKDRTCGRYPLKKAVFDVYREHCSKR